MRDRNEIVMEQLAIMQRQCEDRRANAETARFYRARNATRVGCPHDHLIYSVPMDSNQNLFECSICGKRARSAGWFMRDAA